MGKGSLIILSTMQGDTIFDGVQLWLFYVADNCAKVGAIYFRNIEIGTE